MLPTTKARALVAVRKDIESSYQIVRAAVEELAASGGFSLDTLNNRLKGAAVDPVNTMFRAKIEELKKVGRVGSMLVYDNVLKGLERFAGAHIRLRQSPCRGWGGMLIFCARRARHKRLLRYTCATSGQFLTRQNV